MSRAGSNDLLQIAQVLKSNGTEGEIVIGFRDFAPEDINLKEPVFIYYDGLPVPFFIKSFVIKGSSRAIVRLNDIMSYDEAEEIVGKGVFAESDTIEGYEEDWNVLIGWRLKDADGNKIGIITGIEDIPGNPCIHAETAKRQVMLPLHEDLILSLDNSRQEIVMTIPEGLL